MGTANIEIAKNYIWEAFLMSEGLTESKQIFVDKVQFESVYKNHFRQLMIYAMTFLKDQEQAESLIQDVFLKMWEKKEDINISVSVKAYLYKSVYHACLNKIKKRKVEVKFETHLESTKQKVWNQTEETINQRNLEGEIRKALKNLPEQCRTVFQMSRFENLKYREIADRLLISPKTVENHMGKALKSLRKDLKEFLVYWLVILVHLLNNYS